MCLFYISQNQAYVQQLESSRIKLTQLEQDLQRARQQVSKLCRHFIVKLILIIEKSDKCIF